MFNCLYKTTHHTVFTRQLITLSLHDNSAHCLYLTTQQTIFTWQLSTLSLYDNSANYLYMTTQHTVFIWQFNTMSLHSKQYAHVLQNSLLLHLVLVKDDMEMEQINHIPYVLRNIGKGVLTRKTYFLYWQKCCCPISSW